MKNTMTTKNSLRTAPSGLPVRTAVKAGLNYTKICF